MLKTVIAAVLLLAALAPAQARQGLHPDCNVTMPCVVSLSVAQVREGQRMARGRHIARELGIGAAVPARHSHNIAGAVVGHPAGCPQRAFCGCGAAVRVFGRPLRDLWRAANWYRFPRALAAPGTVAVRRHHVFVLEAHLGGLTWQVYDANSGGHATRIHARSIAGYTIVSPR